MIEFGFSELSLGMMVNLGNSHCELNKGAKFIMIKSDKILFWHRNRSKVLPMKENRREG